MSKEEFVRSSGNPFADVGLPHAPELQLKSQLGLEIRRAIEAHGITQAEAARRAQTTQARISRIMHYRTAEMTIDSLLRILNKLGYQVALKVEKVAT